MNSCVINKFIGKSFTIDEVDPEGWPSDVLYGVMWDAEIECNGEITVQRLWYPDTDTAVIDYLLVSLYGYCTKDGLNDSFWIH